MMGDDGLQGVRFGLQGADFGLEPRDLAAGVEGAAPLEAKHQERVQSADKRDDGEKQAPPIARPRQVRTRGRGRSAHRRKQREGGETTGISIDVILTAWSAFRTSPSVQVGSTESAIPRWHPQAGGPQAGNPRAGNL